MPRLFALLLCLPLSGCLLQGNWIPTIWGGAVLEAGTVQSEDGCTATVDAFVVSVLQGALLTPEGTASAVLHGGQLFDLVPPGPQSMASIDVRKGPYPETVFFLGPAEEPGPNTFVGRGKLVGTDNAASDLNPVLGNATEAQRDAMIAAGATALVEGTLTCVSGGVQEARAFRWLLVDDEGLLRCAGPSLEIEGGSFGASVLTAAGERLFPDPEDGSMLPLWSAGADGVILLEDVDAAGLQTPLRDRLRSLFSSEAPCTWEALDPL